MKRFINMIAAVIWILSTGVAAAQEDRYIETGASEVVTLNEPFGRFLIGDPTVADITPINDTSFYILAKGNGKTNIQIFAANKTDLIQTLVVQIGPDLDMLRRTFARLAPNADVDVFFENTSLQLIGTVPDAETRDLLAGAAAGIAGVDPINGLIVDDPRQIRLKVRFLEVSRSLNGDLGVGLQLSGQSGKARATANTFTLAGGALGQLSIIDSAINIDVVLKALEEQGYAKFLAEPTLTSLSGEEASFLAGGEVPITTSNGDGSVETSYKQYGIQLTFRPVVDKDGRITLTLSPEVSQVDFGNLSNGMPSFTTRRASTTVQMRNQQSIVLAGLYQNNQSRGKSEVPAFANLPILGAFFRESSLRSQETEVLIVITPSLSTVTGSEHLFQKKLDQSQASSPDALFSNGFVESKGYDLGDLLKGKGITGSFGPMISNGGKGVLNGSD